MDDNTKKELQSAVFERLIEHLKKRKDVQLIYQRLQIENFFCVIVHICLVYK